MARVLALAGLRPDARYVVFHCLDKINIDGNYYYESLDLFDALHPQTILAYGMNGKPLPVGHGAPLRLRVELQIGYKNAKYVDRIEVVDRLDAIGRAVEAGGRTSTTRCGTRGNSRQVAGWASRVGRRGRCGFAADRHRGYDHLSL
jgi:DMSO/TMAO reductase YedYZ molybdopterin-dependent catalytic subunit